MSSNDSQKKVQDSVTEMMLDLDKRTLRTMQGDMHRCAATCCDNMRSSTDDVQNCIERCQRPVINAQSVIEQEMMNLQGRLTRCAQDCHDKVRDKYPGDAGNSSEAQRMLDDCVTRCADEHVKLLPKIRANIDRSLKR